MLALSRVIEGFKELAFECRRLVVLKRLIKGLITWEAIATVMSDDIAKAALSIRTG